MANAPVEFDQRKLFDQSNPLLKATLTNILSFSNDVAGGLGTLLEFLKVLKIFLQSIKDPIALILLPAIDQLIDAIEDLKNIGFGTLTVWPWEAGQLESGIDTTKAQESLRALIVALNDVNPEQLRWNQKTNEFQSIENLGDRDQLKQQTGMSFNFSAYSNISLEGDNVIVAKSLDDTWVNDTLNTIYNYINPKEWEEGDNSAKRIINSLNESFKFRTLTPSQFVSTVNSSFDDPNDPQKPVGSGDYVAFVGFFAFPTHHALRDMINALLKFFSNFLDNVTDLVDDKVSDIELGHPLVISGLETELKIATNEAQNDVDNEITDAGLDIKDAQDEQDEAGADVNVQSVEMDRIQNIIEDARSKASTYADQITRHRDRITELEKELLSLPDTVSTQQDIARESNLLSIAQQNLREQTIVMREYARQYGNESVKAKNLGGVFDEKVEKLKQLEAKKSALEEKRENTNLDTTVLKKKFYTLDNTTKRDLSKLDPQREYVFRNSGPDSNIGVATGTSVIIPMFKEGDLIQQGHVFNDYTAEVVKHVEIRVKGNQIISNKVKVRKPRGSIKENTSPAEGDINVPPIISLDGKQLDTFGGLKVGSGIQGSRDALNFPMFAPKNPDVPNTSPGVKFIATINSGDVKLQNVLPFSSSEKLNNSIYENTSTINKPAFQLMMENFVESLTVGTPIVHNFFVSSSLSETEIPVNPWKRLAWTAFPGMGVMPCIKSVKIDGKEIKKQDIKTQLFKQVKKTKSSKDIEYESMKKITIEVGRMANNGDIEDYPSQFIRVPQSTVLNENLQVPITAYKMEGSASQLPNWKFTRIQDLFPIYGKVLDRIVDKLEYAKDLASGKLDDFDKTIQWFEDTVRDLKKLNEEIQELLLFLASGLDKTGFYTASFSGDDGVNGFKSKLSNAKIKNKNTEPIREFALEPVVVNRIGGDGQEVQAEVLRLVPQEPDENAPTEELLSWSDLDSLKYSGGFVFYAQGNDTKLLDKFLLTSGLKKVEDKENPQAQITQDSDATGDAGTTGTDLAEVTSLLENIQPEVDKIEIEQTGFINDDVFIQANGAETVRKDTQIKITFKNQQGLLTDDEKQTIKNAKGNDFIFDTDMQYGSIFPCTTTDASIGNVILSKDNFETATPLNYSVQPIKRTITINDQEEEIIDSIIIKPQNDLEGLTTYKLKVKTSILSTTNQRLKEEFTTSIGFRIAATTVLDIGLE